MSRVCQVTGKKPVLGNNVSHANNKTRRRFMPNLQYRRFWVEGENRWISLRVSQAGLRTIDKKGIDVVLAAVVTFGAYMALGLAMSREPALDVRSTGTGPLATV